MLCFDSKDYQGAVEASKKSIDLQQVLYKGANWESYYIRAVALMKQFRYNDALKDLVAAQ